MNRLSTELKVGVFAVAVLAILAFMTLKVGGLKLAGRRGYTVYVYFKNSDGLDEKSRVKVAGVEAGVVEAIDLVGGKARVTLRMHPGIRLYSNASVAVKSSGLMGDRFLEVGVGTPDEGVLKDGDTIENVTEVVDVDDLARKLMNVSENFTKLAGTLNDVIGSEEAKNSLNRTIVNLQEITAGLKHSIGADDRRLRKVLDNIDSLTASLNGLIENNRERFSASVSNVRDLSAALKTRAPELIGNLNRTAKELQTMIDENKPAMKNTVHSLDDITNKINSGKGSLGKLVNDDTLYDSVQSAADRINNTMSAVDRFRTYITFEAEYLTKPERGKGYFYVTLAPNAGSSYILGVVGSPVATVSTTRTITTPPGTSVTTEEVKRRIRFTAQYARRIGSGDVRLGVTENTLGLGADYYMLHNRLKISGDAWDFSEDEEGAQYPHVRTGVDYFLFRNLFLSAGLDDLLNPRWRGAYAGGGLKFSNDDWKHLFGATHKAALQ